MADLNLRGYNHREYLASLKRQQENLTTEEVLANREDHLDKLESEIAEFEDRHKVKSEQVIAYTGTTATNAWTGPTIKAVKG